MAINLKHTLLRSALFLGLAIAASGSAGAATAEQRAACTPDVYRLCAGEIPSVPAITACMRRQKANLSANCKAVFDK